MKPFSCKENQEERFYPKRFVWVGEPNGEAPRSATPEVSEILKPKREQTREDKVQAMFDDLKKLQGTVKKLGEGIQDAFKKYLETELKKVGIEPVPPIDISDPAKTAEQIKKLAEKLTGPNNAEALKTLDQNIDGVLLRVEMRKQLVDTMSRLKLDTTIQTEIGTALEDQLKKREKGIGTESVIAKGNDITPFKDRLEVLYEIENYARMRQACESNKSTDLNTAKPLPSLSIAYPTLKDAGEKIKAGAEELHFVYWVDQGRLFCHDNVKGYIQMYALDGEGSGKFCWLYVDGNTDFSEHQDKAKSYDGGNIFNKYSKRTAEQKSTDLKMTQENVTKLKPEERQQSLANRLKARRIVSGKNRNDKGEDIKPAESELLTKFQEFQKAYKSTPAAAPATAPSTAPATTPQKSETYVLVDLFRKEYQGRRTDATAVAPKPPEAPHIDLTALKEGSSAKEFQQGMKQLLEAKNLFEESMKDWKNLFVQFNKKFKHEREGFLGIFRWNAHTEEEQQRYLKAIEDLHKHLDANEKEMNRVLEAMANAIEGEIKKRLEKGEAINTDELFKAYLPEQNTEITNGILMKLRQRAETAMVETVQRNTEAIRKPPQGPLYKLLEKAYALLEIKGNKQGQENMLLLIRSMREHKNITSLYQLLRSEEKSEDLWKARHALPALLHEMGANPDALSHCIGSPDGPLELLNKSLDHAFDRAKERKEKQQADLEIAGMIRSLKNLSIGAFTVRDVTKSYYYSFLERFAQQVEQGNSLQKTYETLTHEWDNSDKTIGQDAAETGRSNQRDCLANIKEKLGISLHDIVYAEDSDAYQFVIKKAPGETFQQKRVNFVKNIVSKALLEHGETTAHGNDREKGRELAYESLESVIAKARLAYRETRTNVPVNNFDHLKNKFIQENRSTFHVQALQNFDDIKKTAQDNNAEAYKDENFANTIASEALWMQAENQLEFQAKRHQDIEVLRWAFQNAETTPGLEDFREVQKGSMKGTHQALRALADSHGTLEFFDMSDENWELSKEIMKEVAIQAVLIAVSGGAASVLRAGVTAGLRSAFASAALRQAVLKAPTISRLGIGATGLAVEGVAFHAIHSGLNTTLQGGGVGDWWKQQTLEAYASSTATLGLLHGISAGYGVAVGKGTTTIGRGLNQLGAISSETAGLTAFSYATKGAGEDFTTKDVFHNLVMVLALKHSRLVPGLKQIGEKFEGAAKGIQARANDAVRSRVQESLNRLKRWQSDTSNEVENPTRDQAQALSKRYQDAIREIDFLLGLSKESSSGSAPSEETKALEDLKQFAEGKVKWLTDLIPLRSLQVGDVILMKDGSKRIVTSVYPGGTVDFEIMEKGATDKNAKRKKSCTVDWAMAKEYEKVFTGEKALDNALANASQAAVPPPVAPATNPPAQSSSPTSPPVPAEAPQGVSDAPPAPSKPAEVPNPPKPTVEPSMSEGIPDFARSESVPADLKGLKPGDVVLNKDGSIRVITNVPGRSVEFEIWERGSDATYVSRGKSTSVDWAMGGEYAKVFKGDRARADAEAYSSNKAPDASPPSAEPSKPLEPAPSETTSSAAPKPAEPAKAPAAAPSSDPVEGKTPTEAKAAEKTSPEAKSREGTDSPKSLDDLFNSTDTFKPTEFTDGTFVYRAEGLDPTTGELYGKREPLIKGTYDNGKFVEDTAVTSDSFRFKRESGQQKEISFDVKGKKAESLKEAQAVGEASEKARVEQEQKDQERLAKEKKEREAEEAKSREKFEQQKKENMPVFEALFDRSIPKDAKIGVELINAESGTRRIVKEVIELPDRLLIVCDVHVLEGKKSKPPFEEVKGRDFHEERLGKYEIIKSTTNNLRDAVKPKIVVENEGEKSSIDVNGKALEVTIGEKFTIRLKNNQTFIGKLDRVTEDIHGKRRLILKKTGGTGPQEKSVEGDEIGRLVREKTGKTLEVEGAEKNPPAKDAERGKAERKAA